MLCFIFLTRF